MATTPTVLFRGAATVTTSTVLYTTPASTTTIVTEIMVANTSGSAQTFTIGLAGTSIATTTIVNANDTTIIPCKQVLVATNTITGGASATSVNFSISGVQIV
jgi:hypothetical protein